MDIFCALRSMTSGQMLLAWLVILLTTGAHTQHICDDCDCSISDPDNGEKAIFNAKPRCHQGQITWLSSYGAVRLELTPRTSGDYRYCVRVQSENIKTVVSQEVFSRTHGNYKLKILDNVEIRLSPLFTTRGQGREYCISGSGALHLYVETERTPEDTGVPKVRIHYELDKGSNSFNFSPMDECRPCTDRELLRAYCISDFVAVGSMDDVLHEEADGLSSIKVSVNQLVTQNEAVFQKSRDGWSRPHELKGVVHVPRKCGIRHGDGQFLFTGRVRLGQPMIQCAPRNEQWKEILENAILNGELECSYR